MSSHINPKNLKFPTGAVIFREGDARQYLHIVQKGQIAIFKMTIQGQKLPLALIGPNEFLGENGLLDGKATHGNWAVALTETELIAIPVASIADQLKAAPPWLVSMSKGLAQKVRKMNEIVRRNKIDDEALKNAMIAVEESESRRQGKKS